MQDSIKLVDVATWKQAEVSARAGLGIIKSSDGEPEIATADEVAELTGKAAAESDRVVKMIMSRGDRDRDGDRINQRGWDTAHYEKNPVALFAHDYKDLPIGKSLKTWVGDSKGGPVLRAMIQFATADMNPRADMVYKLLKSGYLNAGSVGFMPKEYSPDEKQEGEDSSTRVGYRIDSAQLLENSIVPVGSHPGALAEARDAKIDLAPMVEWIERILDDSKDLWIPRKDIENAWAIVRPQRTTVMAHADTVVMPLKDVEERVKEAIARVSAAKSARRSKGAIAYKKLPLADKGDSWDGPKETASASIDDLKIICAWVDSANADQKGAYKLPHHHASGSHATVWAGVKAAMGALLGARGGVDVPAGDKKGVYSHLAKHYSDFGETAPDFKDYSDDEWNKLFGEPKTEPATKAIGGSIQNAQDCLAALSQCVQFLLGKPEIPPEYLVLLDTTADAIDGLLDIQIEEAGLEDEDDEEDMTGGKIAEPVETKPAAKEAPKPQPVRKDNDPIIFVLSDDDKRAKQPDPGRIPADPEAVKAAIRELFGAAAPTR